MTEVPWSSWTDDMIHAAAWRNAFRMGDSAYRKYLAENADDPVGGAIAAGVLGYLSVAEELRAKRSGQTSPKEAERSEAIEVGVSSKPNQAP